MGIGSYAPEYRLTNGQLEQLVDTNDDWIVKRTGIRERRICKGETTWEMGLKAGQAALNDCGLDASELDLILVSTVTPDSYTPTVSCTIQDKLGASKAMAVDLSAACSGFVYASDVADSYIRSGKAKHVLVVSVERLSSIIDYTDRTTCVIFGDGAGAAVYTASEDGSGILSTYMRADGSLGHSLFAGALPVESDPLSGERAVDAKYRFLKMGGSEVFRFTSRAVPDAIDNALTRAGISAADVDWFVLHQANQRILHMVATRYGLDEEKVYTNIDRFGNTSSASIPLCLAEMKEKNLLQSGQTILMSGFGGGLTYGAIVIKL
ncbi:MAG: ketoacyl-ACP synthase III [Clostridiaceae bacterium]|nr:ketoacyl-ACP synthase III [Clostridiaceae bacterium]